MKNPLIIARRTLKSGKKSRESSLFRSEVAWFVKYHATSRQILWKLILKSYWIIKADWKSAHCLLHKVLGKSILGAEYLAVGMTFSYLSKKRVVHKLWTIFSRRACWALCLKIHNRNEGSLVSCSTSWYQVHTSLPKKKQQHKKQKQPCTLGNIHFKLCLIF